MGNSEPPAGAAARGPQPESSPPEDPKVNDTWLDDEGELYCWNGKEWTPFEDVQYFEPNTSFRDLR